MRLLRLSITICLVLAAAVAAGTATAAVTPAPAPPRAELTHFSCRRALDPANRSIRVRAVMRPLTATHHLAVRFDLLQRIGAAPATVVRSGDLGGWITPADATLGQVPGDVWRLDKSVIDLAAPATYQFRVTFRWVGGTGHPLGTVVRRSRICRQRELRPDLAVTSLAVSPVPGRPNQDQYTAVIANRGATGAGPFQVLFVPGAITASTVDMVRFLAAGHTRTLSFTGPVCDPADPPSVTADAARQVDDYNRANNRMTAVCPGNG